MPDNILNKVNILIQQEKYSEAERMVKDLLSSEPNNPSYLAILSEINLRLAKASEALLLINAAIGIAPDVAHFFYLKARILIHNDNYDEAENNLKQALELDPADGDYFALWGSVKLQRKQYQEALKLADKSLSLDAENILGLNVRSNALIKLNFKEEAYKTIEGALREDPNNPFTHTNYGWSLLEKGNHKKALEHFKEALKINPNFAFAQAGMLEAIKASNPIYRLFLKYSFWIGNLTKKYQWAVIIGFYVGFKLIRTVASNNPGLQPFLNPLIIALAIFAFSTWVITPISNLFLRFNKYGKFLLDKNEKMSSNFVAVSFVVFLFGVSTYLFTNDERFLAPTAFGFAMMVPLGVMFSPSKYKYALIIYAGGMAIVGLGACFVAFTTGQLYNSLSTIFMVAFIAFQWVANYLMIDESNY